MLAVIAAVLLGSCDDGGGGKSSKSGDGAVPASLGDPCLDNGDCSSGMCLRGAATHDMLLDKGFCSTGCSEDSDCCSGTGSCRLSCGTGPGGVSICAPPCAEPNGFACVDGRAVACTELGESSCGQCGCPDGQRCEGDPNRCFTLLDVGAGCTSDGDCSSNNCGNNGTCRVAVAEPCDETNCDLCLVKRSWSWCSRVCEGPDDCGNAGMCLQPEGEDERTCLPGCATARDGICPAEICQLAEPVGGESGKYYCRCMSCGLAGEEMPDAGPGDGGLDMDAGDDVDAGN